MKYGNIEYQYAAPFAEALVSDPNFRSWLLRQTKFAEFAGNARLMDREMKAKRSASAQSWWRSHYTEKCRCDGCGGRETDLLAIFEAAKGVRFALHVEVKQPNDKFDPDKRQGERYSVRAQCWARKAPAAVLPHTMAATMLLFSESKRHEYSPHLAHFGTLITFEDVQKNFPKAAT